MRVEAISHATPVLTLPSELSQPHDEPSDARIADRGARPDPQTHVLGEEAPEEELAAVQRQTEFLNELLESIDRRLEFNVHRPTGRICVKVVQPSSGRVVREVPNSKLLDLVSGLREIAGLVIDEVM